VKTFSFSTFFFSQYNFRPVTLDVISRPQLLLALRSAGVIHVLRKSGHCDHIADPDGQVRIFVFLAVHQHSERMNSDLLLCHVQFPLRLRM